MEVSSSSNQFMTSCLISRWRTTSQRQPVNRMAILGSNPGNLDGETIYGILVSLAGDDVAGAGGRRLGAAEVTNHLAPEPESLMVALDMKAEHMVA